MERITFEVEGSKGDKYDVAFEISGIYANASCSCAAGAKKQYCNHRFALLDGDVSRLLSGNTADVVRLKSLIEGTDLKTAYDRVLQAESILTGAKQALDAARKTLTRAMYR